MPITAANPRTVTIVGNRLVPVRSQPNPIGFGRRAAGTCSSASAIRAGRHTNVARAHSRTPPPAMMPNSATPRNRVKVAQKNASAVVTAAVVMPTPTPALVSQSASSRSSPSARCCR